MQHWQHWRYAQQNKLRAPWKKDLLPELPELGSAPGSICCSSAEPMTAQPPSILLPKLLCRAATSAVILILFGRAAAPPPREGRGNVSGNALLRAAATEAGC